MEQGKTRKESGKGEKDEKNRKASGTVATSVVVILRIAAVAYHSNFRFPKLNSVNIIIMQLEERCHIFMKTGGCSEN